MKIEIDIDIESIIIEAIKRKQVTDVYVPPIEVTVPTSTENSASSRSKWEYGRKNGRRRSLEEMALHDLEKEKGRRLTPEEKGQAKALVQIDETAENKAKEDTIRKIQIDKLTAEGMAAASKELAEEKERRDPNSVNANKYAERAEDKKDDITRVQEGMDKHDVEATIPKADTIETETLFHD